MRGSRIDRICDFGGSLPPVKPSTRMRRSRRRHRLEHRLHLIRIVGQRRDLLAREHGGERVAARIERGRLVVAADRHVLGDFLDRQRDRPAVVAGPHAIVADMHRLEAGELRLDRVAAGRQISIVATPVADVVTGAIPAPARRGLLPGDRDLGVRNHTAGLIDDGDDEPGGFRPQSGLPTEALAGGGWAAAAAGRASTGPARQGRKHIYQTHGSPWRRALRRLVPLLRDLVYVVTSDLEFLRVDLRVDLDLLEASSLRSAGRRSSAGCASASSRRRRPCSRA